METQILYTDDEAAKFVTDIRGWVSKDGFFYGDNKASEDAARYAGCTHRACENCGEPTEKMYTVCARCRTLNAEKRYMNRELVDWDEKTPLYSEVYDQYFFDKDDLWEFLFDIQRPITEEVRLVLCEPVKLKCVDEDYWSDDLPEEGELPDSILEALEGLRIAIDGADPVAWSPGKFRVNSL
jgi:hypothetical protein